MGWFSSVMSAFSGPMVNANGTQMVDGSWTDVTGEAYGSSDDSFDFGADLSGGMDMSGGFGSGGMFD